MAPDVELRATGPPRGRLCGARSADLEEHSEAGCRATTRLRAPLYSEHAANVTKSSISMHGIFNRGCSHEGKGFRVEMILLLGTSR